MKDGAIANFGDDKIARKYRGDRVEMWLDGAISSDIMEVFLD